MNEGGAGWQAGPVFNLSARTLMTKGTICGLASQFSPRP